MSHSSVLLAEHEPSSMLSFVITIAIFSFQDAKIQQEIVAAPAVIVLILLVWEISIHWKSSSGEEGTLWQRIKKRLKLVDRYPHEDPEV